MLSGWNAGRLAAIVTGACVGLACVTPTLAAPKPGPTPVAERVGVLVTDWGTPEGFSKSYYYNIGTRTRVGEAQTAPREACTEGFVGTFPFRSQFGVYPHAVAYRTPGVEQAWDGFGVYIRTADGSRYVNVVDPSQVLTADDVAGVKMFQMRDVPLDLRARTVFAPNKWDPNDYLSAYWQIQKPNGIADVVELDVPYWTRVVGILRPGIQAVLNPMTRAMEPALAGWFERNYGDRVEMRFGNYEAVEGASRRQEDVAVDFAKDGYRKLLLTRETTDNNHYANRFATRSWVDLGLCRAGFRDDMQIDQVRQVGRTPEYNRMLLNNLERYLKEFDAKQDVAMLYVTYGLPWPGGNPNAGPFSAPHPWIQEVYHENAYNNYLSFKRYAEAEWGRRWRLAFDKSGGEGGPDARTRNLYGYGIFPASYYGDADDPLRFTTIRDNLEQAIRVDGRKQVLVYVSHWYYDGLDNALTIREMNDLPLNTPEEMARGEFAPRWCERYTGPGQFEQQREPKRGGCPDGWTRIVLSEAFDDVKEQFFTGYANRIRGGVERFGQFPSLGVDVLARGQVTRAAGGKVAIGSGPLAGAALEVRPDPAPTAPDGYTWARSYRAPNGRDPGNRSPDAIRPFNEFAKATDHLTSAWDDFTAYIGTQQRIDGGRKLPTIRGAASPAVYYGPYRELFNAPAIVTLPFDRAKVKDPGKLRPYIFNEVTRDYDPVFVPPGGAPIRVDAGAGTASFDTQVLGIFVLAEQR